MLSLWGVIQTIIDKTYFKVYIYLKNKNVWTLLNPKMYNILLNFGQVMTTIVLYPKLTLKMCFFLIKLKLYQACLDIIYLMLQLIHFYLYYNITIKVYQKFFPKEDKETTSPQLHMQTRAPSLLKIIIFIKAKFQF